MASSTGKQENPETTNKKTLMVTLRSSDNQEFLVPRNAAVLSETISNMVEDFEDSVIPLPLVDGKTLSRIIVYVNKHSDESVSDGEKKEFDREFLEGKSNAELFDYVLAANYLSIRKLLDLVCQKIADIAKNKGVKWARKTFGIENDFTPEEEEDNRKKHQWAFEGDELEPDDY